MAIRRKLISALVLASLLPGCTSLPKLLPNPPTQKEAVAKVVQAQAAEAEWNSPGVVEEGEIGVMLLAPNSAPEELMRKPIDLRLAPNASFEDLSRLLELIEINLAISDDDVDKRVKLTRYKGTIGGLFKMLEQRHDQFLSWQGESFVLKERETYGLAMPQDGDFLKSVTAELSAHELKPYAAESAGLLLVDVKPSQRAFLQQYLSRVARNAAMISMQVGVINVTLDGAHSYGVDWSKLSTVIGKRADYALKGEGSSLLSDSSSDSSGDSSGDSGSSTTGGSSDTTTSDTASSDTSSTSNAIVHGMQAALLGGGLRGQVVFGAFSFSGLLNLLNTFGLSETVQNTMLTTVSGRDVELTSGTEVPYVTNVGIGGVGGNSGSSATVGTANTSTAKSGVTLKLKPKFDSYGQMVTVEVDLKVDAVLGFNTLSAGNQLGQLSQPTTQKQSFNGILRLRPGQTMVIGGVRYSSSSDKRSGLRAPTDHTLGGGSVTTQQNEMFIVIRPSVTLFGKPDGQPVRDVTVTTPSMDDVLLKPVPLDPGVRAKTLDKERE